MKKVIISENERGFLYKDGKFIKLLRPGKYYTYGGREIETVLVEGSVYSQKCTLDVLMACPEIKEEVTYAEIPEQHIGLHYINGKFQSVVLSGRFAWWNVCKKNEIKIVDMSSTEVQSDISEHILSKLSSDICRKFTVEQFQKGRLIVNGRMEKILEPGVYWFWNNGTDVRVSTADTRLKQMNITGQEIMTADKVSVRINLVCSYRITDYVKSFTEVDDFEEHIHVAAQLALRDYVGRYKLDDILAGKEEMSEYVFGRLKEKEAEFFAEITEAGVKDIILPGEIRDIMNTVLVAEKRAQANVITRREEVASTRSLLNTAKLMDENETLWKLKELEYIERICENVGNISLNGSGDILAQLTSVLGKH